MSEVKAECVIIGDSWLNTNRLKPIVSENQRKEQIISIFPHKGPSGYTATLKNLSKGSLAMSQVMEDQELLGKWIRSKPIVTVISLTRRTVSHQQRVCQLEHTIPILC